MKKQLIGLCVAGLMAVQANATEFNDVVIFGDSLSDGGQYGSRFTTNPGKTTAELVAEGVGIETIPSTQGGSNYAYGGATVADFSNGIPTLQQQLAIYLNANNGVADANTLYQVWGGANDIFAYATSYASGSISATQLQTGLVTSASTELALLTTLKDAGASYVVVYNMPDIGLTPSYVNTASSATATALATLYNSTLNSGLNTLSDQGLNIIPVNVYGLLQEIAANPTQYGFSNVTDMACSSGSSLGCTDDGTGYLFADGVHPTAYTHQILSKVVLSTLNAPKQISLLTEAPLALTQAHYRAIKNEMLNDMNGAQTRAFVNLDYNHQKIDSNKTSPGLSANQVNLSLGFDGRLSENLSLGMGLNIGQQRGDFASSLGEYALNDYGAIIYALYHQSNAYLGGFFNAGRLSYNDIKRNIQIGDYRRTEKGDVEGTHVGGGLDGGWWFNYQDIKTGPFAHLEWQSIKLDRYQENSSDSTAMWFDDLTRDSFVTTLGWRIQGNYKLNGISLQPVGEIAWNHESKDDATTVKAGLNSMNGYFKLTGYQPDTNWGSATLGVNAQLKENLSSWLMLNSTFAHDSKQDFGVNAGLKVKF
ncbi:autotransporter outer membrane beta-barrel domain-containing protein [Acinetobacter qingfengensis]|nr:autotransporter domain-containing protein [Acinetobacter qingfengensis]